MRCTSPLTVGFQTDGKTLCWSKNKYSKEYPTFQLPCNKCVACRLEYARQWAIRCIHESQMHPENSFITLTYSDENLHSDKLQYSDFQTFMKALRHSVNQKVGMFVTGEYGEKTKRPHWHAIIFNWRPKDLTYQYTNNNGDKLYTSETLKKLWPHGNANIGQVTLKSAGYCARYAAKKLAHGHDDDEYKPISKKSSHYAIGKKFLETYWTDIFNIGKVVLPDGTTCAIPRYYEKWLKKHQPHAWINYVTRLKQEQLEAAIEKENNIIKQEIVDNTKRYDEMGMHFTPQITRNETQKQILQQKNELLHKHNKL